MNKSSVQRHLDAFIGQVERAAAEGRGEQLMRDFTTKLSEDLAESIFLRMDSEVRNATKKTINKVFEWCNEFPYASGLELVAGTEKVWRTAGASEQQIKSFCDLAASAYANRLNTLMESSSGGGRA